jgi:transposase
MSPNNYPHGKLPTKISRADFNKFVDPYLSKTIKGPSTKISRFKIFNYILYVLHTGIQWKQLKPNRKEIHWSNVYRWHNKWSKDGSYQNLFESSIMLLNNHNKLDLSVLYGDGSNTIAKKGAKMSDIQDTNIKKA